MARHCARFCGRCRWVLGAGAGACIAALAVAAMSAVPFSAAAASRSSPQAREPHRECRGTDMLIELKTSNPELHARVLEAAANIENAGAILWRIEKPGTAPSHLFGTMHVSDTRITTLSPAARKALQDLESR